MTDPERPMARQDKHHGMQVIDLVVAAWVDFLFLTLSRKAARTMTRPGTAPGRGRGRGARDGTERNGGRETRGRRRRDRHGTVSSDTNTCTHAAGRPPTRRHGRDIAHPISHQRILPTRERRREKSPSLAQINLVVSRYVCSMYVCTYNKAAAVSIQLNTGGKKEGVSSDQGGYQAFSLLLLRPSFWLWVRACQVPASLSLKGGACMRGCCSRRRFCPPSVVRPWTV